MVASCISLVSLYSSFLRRSLTKCGLSSQVIDVDADTKIHFWGPKKPISLENSSNLEGDDQQKSSLVLIHGFGAPAMWQWQRQVSLLVPHFNVYIPDLVFFGESTTASSERSEIFQAKAIAKLMDKIGIDRYLVIGTSYGGFVAYRMAEMWPERVQKVVIASSGVNMRPSDNIELLKKAKMDNIEDLMMPETAKQLRVLTRLAVFKRVYMPNCVLNDFIEKFNHDNRKEKLELMKGLTIGQHETPNISPLQQKVLIIWGEHDNIFLLDVAKELKEMLGQNASLEVIKKTSHAPQLEHPKAFNKILYNFLTASS
ncbi:uncharacterized protein [Rutidosis leptorrhynchoides]|uniref:uncharacterized protein n=1 Tax=Rutidosis leptorrhynchoides TaxID=125765 RepID=UPI003A99C8FF